MKTVCAQCEKELDMPRWGLPFCDKQCADKYFTAGYSKQRQELAIQKVIDNKLNKK